MKIYKHGNICKYKEYKVTCGDCSCEFSYLLHDLTAGITYDAENKTLVPFRFVRCPECFALYLHPEIEEEDPDPNTTPPVQDLDDVDDEF